MNQTTRHRYFGGLLLLLLPAPLFVVFSGQSEAEKKLPRAAPISGWYQEYIKNMKAGIPQEFSDDGHPLGLIPSIHDLSYANIESPARVYELPDLYDLRTLNKLTSVKNQGNCGCCWAFTSCGSLESYLMPSENRNFSEQNLIDHHGFDWGPCEGGNMDIAAAYLARWDGPLNESDDPYSYAANLFLPDIRKHVQNVIYFPPRSSASDNDRIKQAVMNYGGIYASMYYSSAYYNFINTSYYNPSEKVGSHAVVIVGWDNNFDRNKFNQVPAGNGAFIAKNSWGSGWGAGGYFYVSYYDAFFARRSECAAVTAEPATTYQEIYQVDPLGWVSSLGYANTNTAWGANIFTTKSSLPLSAVSFYCTGRSNRYEIYVYTGVSVEGPRTGVLAAAKSGSTDNPGYYTIPLDSVVPLYPGQKFSVVIKFLTEGYNFPLPIEYPYPDYSSQASANSGESFISSDGNDWYDLPISWGGKYANSNICIKAFAGYPGTYPPENFSLQRVENHLIFSTEYINRLGWAPNPKNAIQIVKYKIYRKRKGSDSSTYKLFTELPATVFSYEDRGLKNKDLYTYGILCVDEWNRESDLTEISNEEE